MNSPASTARFVIPFVFLAAFSPAGAFPVGRDTLANGMAVLVVEDHKLPMFELRLVIKSGASEDPDGKEGLAHAVAELLLRGTGTRTTMELSDEFGFLGARYWSSADEDQLSVGIRARSTDLDRVLGMLADIVRNPAFPDSEIERVRGEKIAELSRSQDEPDVVANRAFARLLFGAHPYGHPVDGYETSLATVDRGDIVNFYRSRCVPNNTFLVGVGDLKREEFVCAIEKYFGEWQRGSVPRKPSPPPPPIERPRVRVIIKPEINQDYIVLGSVGISQSHPRALAARIMAFTLGSSGLTSRIATAIREENGLAYDASAYFDRRIEPGPFVAQLQTETKNGQEAVLRLIAEIRKMKQSGVTEAELARAKAYYIGHFPLSFESLGEKTGMVVQIERHGLGLDYVDAFIDRVRAVTREEVNDAARDLLHPDNYVLVIVGNTDKKDFNLGEVEWIE